MNVIFDCKVTVNDVKMPKIWVLCIRDNKEPFFVFKFFILVRDGYTLYYTIDPIVAQCVCMNVYTNNDSPASVLQFFCSLQYLKVFINRVYKPIGLPKFTVSTLLLFFLYKPSLPIFFYIFRLRPYQWSPPVSLLKKEIPLPRYLAVDKMIYKYSS